MNERESVRLFSLWVWIFWLGGGGGCRSLYPCNPLPLVCLFCFGVWFFLLLLFCLFFNIFLIYMYVEPFPLFLLVLYRLYPWIQLYYYNLIALWQVFITSYVQNKQFKNVMNISSLFWKWWTISVFFYMRFAEGIRNKESFFGFYEVIKHGLRDQIQ